MPTFNDSYAGPLGEVRAASTAGGGTALTTTAAVVHLPNGVNWLSLTPRNFSTAVVVRFALTPYLIVFKTQDNLATLTDYSSAAQDADTGTSVVLSSLGAAADGDYMYVGSHLPFRGVTIDVDAANSTNNTLTVKYWKSDSSWADISATDNTDTGASLAQDGTVVWTIPTDWLKASLVTIATPAPATGLSSTIVSAPYYWTRWEWTSGLDASTTLDSVMALARSTAYGELVSGQPFETAILKGIGGIAGVEALTDAGTANLIVNVGVRPPLLGVGLP